MYLIYTIIDTTDEYSNCHQHDECDVASAI